MSCNLEQMTPYGYVMEMEMEGGGSYRIFSLITEVITREVSGVSEKDENRKPNKCVDKILYPSSTVTITWYQVTYKPSLSLTSESTICISRLYNKPLQRVSSVTIKIQTCHTWQIARLHKRRAN